MYFKQVSTYVQVLVDVYWVKNYQVYVQEWKNYPNSTLKHLLNDVKIRENVSIRWKSMGIVSMLVRTK